MGWETHDDPLPSGNTYTMLTLREGGRVGALYASKESGPAWITYTAVADAPATAARARELGGKVLSEPTDVGIGVMAVLADPTGATFCLWQKKVHHGFDHTDARPGTFCWAELITRDVDRAGPFYTKLFGWKPESMPMPQGTYTVFKSGDVSTGGMMRMADAFARDKAYWSVYFSVVDCDAAAAAAEKLGGSVLSPPADIPNVGRFALLADPQGATFSVLQSMS
jgi:predicted enzyme related to lactoylglutathione lyase